MSGTGQSAKRTCESLGALVWRNNQGGKLFSKHRLLFSKYRQGLKLAETLPTSETLFERGIITMMRVRNRRTWQLLGQTRTRVERTVSVSYANERTSNLFIELSLFVRACGRVPGQPLQCLDQKRSKCIWSLVGGETPGRRKSQIKSGQKLQGKVYKQGSCDSRLLQLASSSRL